LASTPQSHATTIALCDRTPQEVPAGSEFSVTLSVSCTGGCDLRGRVLRIASPDGAVAVEGPLPAETEDQIGITLKAPPRVGEHTWTVSLPPGDANGVLHDEATLSIAVKTIPHVTSLAVWDIPSPVTMGERFTVAVGAKSGAGCSLVGTGIDICDSRGVVVAHGVLGDAPWPGTSALYWTRLELTAPSGAGLAKWSARFSATDIELPHDGSAHEFSAAIIGRPEHRLTVTIVESETRKPIEDVQVRLGPYRAVTDRSGRAEIDVAKGTYDLSVWKVEYEAPVRRVEIDADVSVEVEALLLPEEDPDAIWAM
jgi:hypothetical protein